MEQVNQKLYECPECHLKYKDKEWAEKCEEWCHEHHSCNLEITAHASRRMVLFACAENKKRSQMAEAIFNHFAKNSMAESAGTMPAQEIDPKVKEVLKEIGIVIANNIVPKKVNNEMLENFDLIISFGCLVRAMFPQEKFEEWHLFDPQTIEEFRAVRDELVEKIKKLIQKNDF